MAACDAATVDTSSRGVGCAAAASAACASPSRGASPVQFFNVAAGVYGVAVCAASGAAVACSSAPASAFILPAGGVNTTAAPTAISAPYASVSGATATALLTTPDGSVLKVRDSFSLASKAAATTFGAGAGENLLLLRVDRIVGIVSASGGAVGHCSRFSLSLLTPSAPLASLLWYSPGLLYGNGTASPAWAIGGDAAAHAQAHAVVFREDRPSAPLAMLIDGASSSSPAIAGVFLPSTSDGGNVPNTVLNDTLWGGALVDARMTFAGLGYEAGEMGAALTVTFPGSEYPKTYQSHAPNGLWRFHPLVPNAPTSAFAAVFVFGALAPPAPSFTTLHATIDWATRASLSYFSPLLRSDIDLLDAHEALVASLADTFLPAAPLPGVPTGFDKMTGIAYSSIIELGFVGPQLRMAVSLLQSGLARGGNHSRVAIATAMLDAWVAATGPGFSHAVWDMGVTSGAGAGEARWVDDGAPGESADVVYLRRVVVSHNHALEAARLASRYCDGNAGRASRAWLLLCEGNRILSWQNWGLSLAPVLLSLQASNGSFARQYALPSAPGGLPQPSQASCTATALPLRYLVTAANVSGNASYLAAAVAAGEYAWAHYGAWDTYVGGAIDNPDVIDKESALFAMDGFLALHQAVGAPGPWLERASMANVVASSWVRVTDFPNPVDARDMDWDGNDTSAGLALIAVGHSGSDTFDSMFVWPRLALCGATGDVLHTQAARCVCLCVCVMCVCVR